jgi:hypothetical protein
MPIDLLFFLLEYFVLPAAVIVGILGSIAVVFAATVLAEIPRHPEMLRDGFDSPKD